MAAASRLAVPIALPAGGFGPLREMRQRETLNPKPSLPTPVNPQAAWRERAREEVFEITFAIWAEVFETTFPIWVRGFGPWTWAFGRV